jgi:hypothetical protein
MTTNALRLLFSTFLTLGAISVACSSGETVGPATGAGTGNVTGTAGTTITGVGNTTGSAGTTGVGNTTGSAGRGGTTGVGNTTGTAGRGGTTGVGNTTGTAGTTGVGNTTGTAGTTGVGNTTGTAGTTGTGTGTAGTTGTTTCGASFDVTADGFAKAPAAGGACWHGYSFAGGDAGSTITPTSFMACGMPCMLKMMGTVGPAVAPAYAGVAYLGFNLAQENGAMTMTTVTPTGSGVTVTFSATTATLPLRAQLSGTGSAFWCYTITTPSPVTIPYAMFNSTCWEPLPANAYAKQPITNFELVVPGAATATSGVSVTLMGVKENP